MKLSVKELKTFKQKAASIKTNGILPITNYLKFENNTVTKNALNSFVTQKIKCSESCLIDEKILMQFVDKCDSDEITVKIEDKRITLSDKHTKIVSPTENVNLFPFAHDLSQLTFDLILEEQLDAIKTANSFTFNGSSQITNPLLECIHVGKNSITASDMHILYVYKTEEEMPEMVLDRMTAGALLRMNAISFAQNEKYNYFQSNDATFGFIKTDQAWGDMTRNSIIPPNSPKIIIDREPIVKFNELCMSSSPLKIQVAKMSNDKKNIEIVMNDSSYELDLSTKIIADSEPFDTFSYIPEKMNRLLSVFPDEKITMYRSDKRMYILSETGFITLIQEVL